jgi:peptidoglycan/LPS O-acetylase OafA/YrhL
MNLLELKQKLITAARATPPGDHVPYAFEQRIMARLTGRPAQDPWGFWGRALARAAVLCVAVMLLITAMSYYLPAGNQDSLSQDVEQTLFAAVDNPSTDQAGD